MWHGDEEYYEEEDRPGLQYSSVEEYYKALNLESALNRARQGQPERQNIISKDEILNVEILVNSVNDVTEFLEKI